MNNNEHSFLTVGDNMAEYVKLRPVINKCYQELVDANITHKNAKTILKYLERMIALSSTVVHESAALDEEILDQLVRLHPTRESAQDESQSRKETIPIETDIKKASQEFLVSYVATCKIVAEKIKEGMPVDATALASLNDSARVVLDTYFK